MYMIAKFLSMRILEIKWQDVQCPFYVCVFEAFPPKDQEKIWILEQENKADTEPVRKN